MISSIALVGAVAVVFYIILPAVSFACVKAGWKRLYRRLKKEAGITGHCTGYTEGQLRVLPGGSVNAEILISPKATIFFMLRRNDDPEKLSWRTLFLLQNGTTVYYIQSKERFKPNICVFYEVKSKTVLIGKINSLTVPDQFSNPLKPYFIATGAFIEFILFLEFIQIPDMNIVSIAALIAIFAKALPYCPPGLFLTLAAIAPGKNGKKEKKSRQRKAAGFLLITASIVLNIGVIYFIIRYIGF